LQNPASHPPGQFRPVVSTRQRGLEDLPTAGIVGAGEPRDTDVKPRREADYRQVHQLPSDVISQHTRMFTARALIVDSHRGGVDGGEQAGIGGVGDGQSDFSGAADGVSDEVASSVHF